MGARHSLKLTSFQEMREAASNSGPSGWGLKTAQPISSDDSGIYTLLFPIYCVFCPHQPWQCGITNIFSFLAREHSTRSSAPLGKKEQHPRVAFMPDSVALALSLTNASWWLPLGTGGTLVVGDLSSRGRFSLQTIVTVRLVVDILQ